MGAGGERQLGHRDGDSGKDRCPGRAPVPTQPPAPCPAPPLPHRGVGLVATVPPGPGSVPRHGCRLWGCGPCPVTGRPSGASDCSRWQNNARRAARAPRAAPHRLAWEPPPAASQWGPPSPRCPPSPVLSPSRPHGCAGARGCCGCCSTAQLSSARHSPAPGAAQSPLPSTRGTQLRCGPSSEPRPAAPAQEGGDGGVTLRWSWGRDGVTGTNLRPGEDLKPCLHLAAAWRCQPRAPCGCCRCSCSWGSAASGPGWWLQVSGGQVRGGCPRRGLSAAVPPCVTPNLTAQRARALQGPGMLQGWDTPASPQVSPRSHLDPP